MTDTKHALGWFALVALASMYLTYVISDSFGNKKAEERTDIPVVVRDDVHPGKHQLSGMIMVHSTCDELSVSSKAVSNDTYELEFTTWPEPSIKCRVEPSPRVFNIVVWAPALGVHFTASLDKEPISIAVYPTVAKK